jgi:8-oxo-dGTP diphosphatase
MPPGGEKRGRRPAGKGKPYCYDYPRPSVTVDLAAFALFETGLRVLLIRRKKDPFAGCWALPGGFLEIDEPIEAAARRELREETGLDVPGAVALIGVFGDPGRDPRGRTISLAHATTIRDIPEGLAGADDAAEAAWLELGRCRGLAFDHDAIMAVALDWLGRGVAEGTLGLSLLPVEFGDDAVKALHRALGNPPRTAIAWRVRMARTGRIVPTEAVAGTGSIRFRTVGGRVESRG